MNSSTLFLSLSLLANLALATALLFPQIGSSFTPRDPSARSTSSVQQSDSDTTHPTLSGQSSPGKSTAVAPIPNLWSRLYSADIDQLVSRLKAAGFSYREIRGIVMPMAYKKFETRREEIMKAEQAAPYWRVTDDQFMPDDPTARAELMELMQEQSRIYRKHFNGPEAFAENEDMERYARNRFGDLPIEKLHEISRIQSDYDDLQQETYMAAQKRPNRRLTEEDQTRLKLLKTERDRDIREALTPEQYSDYQLRSSSTAQRLRYQLDLFRPTEAEYKALFALQHPVDEQLARIPLSEHEGSDYHTEARKKLEPQILAALGPERYADYKQATEAGNDKVTRLMARLDLPLGTAGKINTVREDINQRAKAVREDKQLSPAERDLRLSALASEAKTKLSATLGSQRGVDAYVDIRGDWLRALQPKPAKP